MACSKFTLVNTGSTPTYFNYQRCDDALWEYQVELLPNQIKNIWSLDGTYQSAFQTGIQIVNQSAFPAPSQTPTQSVTPTTTPTPNPTSSVTPTNTPTNTETPSNTPTNTSTPTNTPTTTPTNTQTPTNTATNTPTNTGTPTNTPTNTGTPTNTPTNTGTPTMTPTPTKSCLTYQYSIDQGDIDYASGNTNPTLDGRLFGGLIQCIDNSNFQPNFTVAGLSINYCVTSGTSPIIPFGYHNDIVFTASASTVSSTGSC